MKLSGVCGLQVEKERERERERKKERKKFPVAISNRELLTNCEEVYNVTAFMFIKVTLASEWN